jgi:hypothetical protein
MARVASLALIMILAGSGASQGGGDFVITQAVIASGGSHSTAGDFSIDATTGQLEAGGAIGFGPFAITSGFWNYTHLAPTAAGVTISGRIVSKQGVGISNARLHLQTQSGQMYVSRSAAFGYYMFEEIEAGQTVFISVEHKLYTFSGQTVMVVDSISDLDFVALS